MRRKADFAFLSRILSSTITSQPTTRLPPPEAPRTSSRAGRAMTAATFRACPSASAGRPRRRECTRSATRATSPASSRATSTAHPGGTSSPPAPPPKPPPTPPPKPPRARPSAARSASRPPRGFSPRAGRPRRRAARDARRRGPSRPRAAFRSTSTAADALRPWPRGRADAPKV
jgi:hypothetical protein